MWFLYMKEDIGYEEFLTVVYEAETEDQKVRWLMLRLKPQLWKR